MRPIRVPAVCLVVAFVLGATIASSSQAAEYGRCLALKGGKYTSAKCTVLGTGKTAKFEWYPAPTAPAGGPAFNGTYTSTGGKATLTTALGKVICKKSTDVGAVTGVTSDEDQVTFTACELNKTPCASGGDPFSSTPEPEVVGQIVTKKLDTTLLEPSSGVAWTQFTAAGGAGDFQAEFHCGAEVFLETSGTLAGVTTATNAMSPGSTTKFTATTGDQGLVTSVFNGTIFEALPGSETEVTTAKDKYTEKLELRAIGAGTVPQSWVSGALLAGTEPIAETTTVTAPFVQKLSGKDAFGLTGIECGTVKIKNGQIAAPGVRTEEGVVYENCKALGSGATGCSVGTAITRPLEATLEGTTGATKLRFVPQAGSELVKWHITGSGCAGAGFYKADGEMDCEYGGVQVEVIEHPLEFTSTSGSRVEVEKEGSGSTAPEEFTGTDKVHLASAAWWSAR